MSDENKTPGASTPAATQTPPPPPPPPPAKEPAKEPVKESTKERISEQLPPKLVEGLKAAGYDMKRKDSVLAVKSYDEQKLWRAVMFDGQRPEISFEGKWLNPPKKPEAKPAKA